MQNIGCQLTITITAMSAPLCMPCRPPTLPRPLYEEVAELLRQRIFKRELEPGSWIDELKIAEEYGISRTPLREALKVLACRRSGDHEGAARRLRHRSVATTTWPMCTTCSACWRADAAGVVATKATDAELQRTAGAAHSAGSSRQTRQQGATTDQFFAHQRAASTCACWRLPTTAGATRWWPTCARS